jgi:hypothetical protein
MQNPGEIAPRECGVTPSQLFEMLNRKREFVIAKSRSNEASNDDGHPAPSSRLTTTAAFAMMIASPPCSAGISSPPLTADTVTVP